MSRYTLLIKNNKNLQGEIQEATQLLQSGDSLSIIINENTPRQSIVDVIEDEKLLFKHITNGRKEYIIAKKEEKF